jgi:GT2 family glycosyltransferase
VLTADADIVGTTGLAIADGARGPGYSFAAAQSIIDDDHPEEQKCATLTAAHAYGCNMAIRLATVRRHRLQFDERLPLYAWSEDMDFSHRLARHGRVVTVLGARGVHLGLKSGRSSGRKLGYSQVANPIYLFGKGSYSLVRAAGSVGRNFLANAVLSLRPEPYIDRRGRLRGNMRAFLDITQGRLAPERILEI